MNRKFFIIISLFLLCASVAQAQEYEWVDPKNLAAGEVRQELTQKQTLEIAQIQKALLEVDTLPLEEWLDGFRRDENTDHEIAIWKRIAAVYTDFLKGRDVPLDYKKDVFKVLVASSMMPREEVAANTGVKTLSAKEVIEIMDRYNDSAVN